MAGLIVPSGVGLTAPPDVARAIQMMKEAGFDGAVEYREDRVEYPGGDYVDKTVTFQSWNGARETYNAALFARYPMITITEASRIGLLVPRPAGSEAAKSAAVAALAAQGQPQAVAVPGGTVSMFVGGGR